MNDANAIRIQGIRVLWNKAPYINAIASAIALTFSPYQWAVARFRRALYEGGLLRSPPEWRAYTHVCTHVAKDCARRRP